MRLFGARKMPRNHHRLQKYVTRPKKHGVSITRGSDDWLDDYEQPKAQTVHESEPQPTGLLDEHGNEIYRLPGKIGFNICRD